MTIKFGKDIPYRGGLRRYGLMLTRTLNRRSTPIDADEIQDAVGLVSVHRRSSAVDKKVFMTIKFGEDIP
jgi:hypothetical protein